jgi:hypothetical protein
MQEPRENLKNRVYYAAKDGMSIALYALLVSGDKQEVEGYPQRGKRRFCARFQRPLPHGINWHGNWINLTRLFPL